MGSSCVKRKWRCNVIRLLLQILFLPLRLLWFFYARLRNLRRPGSILVHRVPDRFTVFRSSGYLSMLVPREEIHFAEYMGLLRVFADSEDLKTILLIVPELHHNQAECDQIAEALLQITAKGKKLIGFSEGGNLRTLLLLSCCSERYSAPAASYASFLPASEPHYFKDLLKKVGVRMDVMAAGRYKSAGEMFSRREPSRAARENLEDLIAGLRKSILSQFEKNVPGLGSRLSKRTLWSAAQLVEVIFFKEEITQAALTKRITKHYDPPVAHAFSPKDQKEEPIEKPERKTSETALVRRHLRRSFVPIRLKRTRSAAFVAMEGTIYSGRYGDQPKSGVISAHAYRSILEELESSRDEAVILWINSPGGTPDGSEIIYQAVRSLGEKKPVIALLSGVAASGGFYIASAAHRIFAMESTITGSIGVVRMQPDAEKLYEKLGVATARIGFDNAQDVLSVSRPVGKEGRKLLEEQITSTYATFLSRVASGRKKEVTDVSRYAEGRVFTGSQFLKTGLIDEIRGLVSAVEFLKDTLKIPQKDPLRLSLYPEVRVDLRALISERLPFGGSKILSLIERAEPVLAQGQPLLYFPAADLIRLQ